MHLFWFHTNLLLQILPRRCRYTSSDVFTASELSAILVFLLLYVS